jgi:hypothetical protein
VFLELTTEKVMIRRLPSEPVAVLRENHRHGAGGYEVSYAIHAWPL